MSVTGRRLLSTVFPGRCVCCGNPADPDILICPDCAETFLRIEPPCCPYCGVSLEDCNCRRKPRPFDGIVAPFYYESGARDAILSLKYRHREDAAIPLAKALSDCIDAAYFGIPFDRIACVPVAREQYVERGYNQAEAIAKRLRLEKNIPLDKGLLRKRETGGPQYELGAAGRQRNIKNAFLPGRHRDISGETILLIDDIFTTGATAAECATILRLSGARRVYVACAAITRQKN